MLTIDEVMFVMIIIFGIIGIVRGFLKELGVTLVLIATLFALDRVIPILVGFLNGGGLGFLGLGPVATSQSSQNLLFVLFSAAILGATYISYQGETLTYEGTPPKGIGGAALGFLIGAVNGYLVFGTLWWLLNIYHYPFGLVSPPLPPSATQIIAAGLLPPDLLAGGVDSVTSWGLLPFILVLLVILKVIR